MVLFIPFTVFTVVTKYEGRYKHGSVYEHIEGCGEVLGMSFMGDMMVWPFIFLVPFSLIITKYAASCSKQLLNRISSKATDEWMEDKGENGQLAFPDAVCADTGLVNIQVWDKHQP